MPKKDEARRVAARIAKAERRLADGTDVRQERDGKVSERAILERLRQRQEDMKR